MKHGKTLFLLAFIFATAAAFAGEALPSSAADWPAKLGMTPKMLFLVLQIGIIIFAAKIGGSIGGCGRESLRRDARALRHLHHSVCRLAVPLRA